MYIHPLIKMFDFHGGTQRCSNIRMTCIDPRSQITSNPVILGIVKRYQIPFPELQPFQVSTPLSLPMPQEKIMLADQEIQELLGEGAIKLEHPISKSISGFSFSSSREGCKSPSRNKLETAHSVCAFRNGERLFLLKKLFKKEDYMNFF